MEEKGSEKDGNILYELLTLAEWSQNSDITLPKTSFNGIPPNTSPHFSLNPWRIFNRSKLDVKKFLQTEYPWHLAVSQDGKVIGILQESLLEIRTAKDEYSSVVGRATIPYDQCPQLRKLAWSPDNTFLAVARDNGIVNIYNLLGCNTATLHPSSRNSSNNNVNSNASGNIQPVIGLIFLQPKIKSTKWSNELFVIYHNGDMRSILLPSLDGCDSEENAKCSLETYFPQGITSVAYHNSHHFIIIAGPSNSKEHGISVWRILNDYPHLKVAYGFEKSAHNSRSFLRFLPRYSSQLDPNTVVEMKISPNGEILACLHVSGEISLWHLPGVRPHRRWSLADQPDYDAVNERESESNRAEDYFHPVDISWWSDSALVIARKSGAITVCSITTLNNLLGDLPEFLSFSPQIASIHGCKSAVMALECEVEDNFRNRMNDNSEDAENEAESSVLHENIQAALYSFTDIERFKPKRKTPRIIQRMYRLLELKRTTPEELYARKIEFEDYSSALMLAKTYNLDCDLVYRKQWRSNVVTKESIYNYLDKINNTFWVVHECIERVPDDEEAAEELLRFGLKKTDVKSKRLRADALDPDDRKIIAYRRQILNFLDSLEIYKKIIVDQAKYSAIEYDRFRRKSPLLNTVCFAREENCWAVEVMFTYRAKETKAYWLPILSNFPETYSPASYPNLLPEICGNEVLGLNAKRLRSEDWSENKLFSEPSNANDASSDFIYECDSSLKEFECEDLTPEMVEKWYIKRTYEIEANTGLVRMALSFAEFGREKKNVKALEHLIFNLTTLFSLVYEVGDMDMTLSRLETYATLQHAELLVSKTSEATLIKDVTHLLHPFASRCERRGSCTLYEILSSVFVNFSKTLGLALPCKLFQTLKEGNKLPFKLSTVELINLALDCLYNCEKSDEADRSYDILECLPVRESSSARGNGNRLSSEENDLHNRIDRLEKDLFTVYCVLNEYEIYPILRYLSEVENDVDEGKKLMKKMAEHMKTTFKFNSLLKHLEYLQSNYFPAIEMSFCEELVASALLSCENEEMILSADFIMQCSRNETEKQISFEKSVRLVLEAARNHLTRARDHGDECVDYARACLKLVRDPHPEVQEESDLIDSLQILEEFGVKILPLEVRNYTGGMELIKQCLAEGKKHKHVPYHRLLQLADYLRIYGEDSKRREGEVLVLMASHALNTWDYDHCGGLCDRLVALNFPPAWSIVGSYASSAETEDVDKKREFMAFAILHCPAEKLEELIKCRMELRCK